MKALIITALILAMACPMYADVTNTAQTNITTTAQLSPPEINQSVQAELNKPIVPYKEQKFTWGDYIWIGALVVVGGFFGNWAYQTRKPI